MRSHPLSSSMRAAALLVACGLGAPALGQDLYVGGPDGVIRRGHPVSGGFEFVGVCGGPIDSMVLDGEDLLVGDTSGNVYHYDASEDLVDYAFTLDTDATGLALRGAELFVSSSDGTVLRVDKTTGQLFEQVLAPVPVEALFLRDTVLYAGSSLGVVFRRDVVLGGDFEFFGTCGGPIESMSADDEALILGDTNGAIYRIDFTTQQVTASYGAGGDNTAMVYHQGDVLVTSSAGDLRRLDARSGRQHDLEGSAFDLRAMALREDPPPGDTYCYGHGCPCGNDDETAGCSNSLGVGAWLRATGSSSVLADDMQFFTTNVPAEQFGVLFMSGAPGWGIIGDGVLCSSGAGGFRRFGTLTSGIYGFYEQGELVDYAQTNFGDGGQLVAGSTWTFQLWYRDPEGPCGSTFNTSNGYLVTFTP